MISAALALFTSLGACSSKDETLSPPPDPCNAADSVLAFEAIDAAELGVYLDAPASPGLELVRQDLGRYLGMLWGQDVAIAAGAPDGSKARSVWISSSVAARAAVGTDIDDGYALKRLPDGLLVVYAPDAQNLAYASYALLEELGARFFHPRAELVPALGGVRLPLALDVERRPAWRLRGMQEHTLHPIETMSVLNEPGAENLEDAKRYVDWLVKTGQNLLQWPLLDVPFPAFKEHADAIVAHAHLRGVEVGAVVQVFEASALQNNYVLIEDADQWQADLEKNLDQLTSIDWDVVALALGEFIGTDPNGVVTWLDHATGYLGAKKPNVEVSVQVHVGNYPNLWVDYQGQKTFFYHLAGKTDPALTNEVHTVFFFDLYRDWGTYKHENFFFQRDYLMSQLGKRKVRYYPESAYWIAADVDVPHFLPEYIHSRWLDISSLHRDTTLAGLPSLDGHVLFSSGKEWGYWLHDYLTAKMQWDPEGSLQSFLRHYTNVFGACSDDLGAALEKLVALQGSYLFDRRLVGYVSGEDNVLDIARLAGYESHPLRKPFEAVAKLSAPELETFERDVVDALRELLDELVPLERSVSRRCARADEALRPWCNELADGFAIDRLRVEHSLRLYQAVIDWVRGGSSHAGHLAAAKKLTERARAVITRREAEYRWPASKLTDAYANPTVYEFGYLRQAHQVCFWERQDLQAETLVTEGVAAPISLLPSCLN